MSAQLKAAYDDLVTYLGKDAKGKEKAKRLKDAANELRKKLAAAEEKLEQVEAVKDAARARADVAEAELASVRAALLREQQRLAVETNRADAAVAETADFMSTCADVDMTPEVIDMPGSAYSESVRKAVRLLRTRMPCLHASTRRGTVTTVEGTQLSVFDRESLAAGWSGANLYTLGAAVAVIVGMLGNVVISTSRTLRAGEMLNNNNATHCEILTWLTASGANILKITPERLQEIQCMLGRGLRS